MDRSAGAFLIVLAVVAVGLTLAFAGRSALRLAWTAARSEVVILAAIAIAVLLLIIVLASRG